MSEPTSKFGMLRNLQQVVPEEPSALKQESTKAEMQQSIKAASSTEVTDDKADREEGTPLKHYSSYMPMPLFAQLQIYVAKRKATRGLNGEKVSIQSVIAEAVQQYLDEHDN